MSEELKGLIEKIQQEGVKAGEDRARDIEQQAKGQAKDIVEKAKREAEKLIAEAKDKAVKTEESTKTSLKQAGRDLLLGLRKEINSMLDRLISSRVREALNPGALAKIITLLVKEHKEKGDIIISLKKEDIENLEKGFLGELNEETKKGITLKPSEDIHGGFIISYDGGKSHYDFTDKALAEYIGQYLKPKLDEVLKDTATKDKKTQKDK
ncbi:MAG: hypothetical protein HQ547_02710 [Candidatus Omnitrophica bacterium]|nr:hypothetical protein [Candidatus Omnitrophota bacterium]